jgi:hypothetical protein
MQCFAGGRLHKVTILTQKHGPFFHHVHDVFISSSETSAPLSEPFLFNAEIAKIRRGAEEDWVCQRPEAAENRASLARAQSKSSKSFACFEKDCGAALQAHTAIGRFAMSGKAMVAEILLCKMGGLTVWF